MKWALTLGALWPTAVWADAVDAAFQEIADFYVVAALGILLLPCLVVVWCWPKRFVRRAVGVIGGLATLMAIIAVGDLGAPSNNAALFVIYAAVLALGCGALIISIRRRDAKHLPTQDAQRP